MLRKLIRVCSVNILFILLCLTSPFAFGAKQAILLEITGAIGPATQDYLKRGVEYAIEKKANFVILRLDTPGGLETSMRGINKTILASPIPIVTYVAPEGARAASAGTFILYASHVAAMAPGTNIGAASPVSIGDIPSPSETNKDNKKDLSTMEKKATHDAAAYIRSLAIMHNRNPEWAEKAVREAVSLSAIEALKLKVIDLIANNIPDLLQKIDGRLVKVQNLPQHLETKDVAIEVIAPDWRFEFLSILTDPTIAYILLLIGIYGLFFEFSNPGFVLPGVVGTISLLLALYAFQLIPINYAGFGLLLLGILFMILEAFVTSFGILGIGGVIAFIIGSIFLLDAHVPGYTIAWQAIVIMSFFSFAFFLSIIQLVIRSTRKNIVTGYEALIGAKGKVIEANENRVLVRIQGEIWKAYSKKSVKLGQTIQVTNIAGLILEVEPILERKVDIESK